MLGRFCACEVAVVSVLQEAQRLPAQSATACTPHFLLRPPLGTASKVPSKLLYPCRISLFAPPRLVSLTSVRRESCVQQGSIRRLSARNRLLRCNAHGSCRRPQTSLCFNVVPSGHITMVHCGATRSHHRVTTPGSDNKTHPSRTVLAATMQHEGRRAVSLVSPHCELGKIEKARLRHTGVVTRGYLVRARAVLCWRETLEMR